MTAPPEDENLARLETAVEALVREVGGIKADGCGMRAEVQDTRATMRRNFLIIIGTILATWLTVISLLLIILFGM